MFNKDTLPNGVRIVTETVPHVESVSVGVWVGAGSRDEDDSNRGISHFIEHMLFKGTETRSAQKIADEFDSIGGHLNAFTEKEYTCYYAKVLREHTKVAVDVIGDMLLNSVLDPKEIEREKNVVLEEIKRHEDSPDDLVHDVLVQTMWNGHPLGKSVIGTSKTVSGLSREDIISFLSTRYTPDSIVISAAGNLNHAELVDQVDGIFGRIAGTKSPVERSSPAFSADSSIKTKTTEQVHFCIGTRGFAQSERCKYPLAIIDASLGGGMSSRLFQEVREKRGLAYAIGSYSVCYSEGGLFAVYGGTSLKNVDEVMELVRSEFASLKRSGVTGAELARGKNQIRGALVLGQESMSGRQMRMGKSELYFGRVLPLEEIITSIQNVKQEDVASVAEQVFEDSLFSVAAIGPFEKRKGVKCA